MWLIFVTFGRGAKVSHLTAEGEALLGFFFRLFFGNAPVNYPKVAFSNRIYPAEKAENIPLTTVNDAFRGTPYCDIIKEYWLQNEGEPVEGERNSKLHKLAYHLGPITIIM